MTPESYRIYECEVRSSTIQDRTKLCEALERENELQAELEKTTVQKAKLIDILDGAIADLHCYGYPIAARRYQAELNPMEGK